MKRIVDTSEVLGTVGTPDGIGELCASAVAEFDEAAGRLVVRLDAFVRPAGLLAKERRISATWLPKEETIIESVALEECHDAARPIFQRWVRKVRDAAPQLHHT